MGQQGQFTRRRAPVMLRPQNIRLPWHWPLALREDLCGCVCELSCGAAPGQRRAQPSQGPGGSGAWRGRVEAGGQRQRDTGEGTWGRASDKTEDIQPGPNDSTDMPPIRSSK